jgi:hypothetical protein
VATVGGTVTSKARFLVTPTVTSLLPDQATVGSTVVLTGTGFLGVKTVALGKQKSVFIVNSPTQITVTVPTKSASGTFKVTTTGGFGTSPSFGVLPSILSFKPISGAIGGSVKVSGQGFTGATSVEINGVPAAAFKASGTSISFKVPPGATTGPIKVTTPAGTATSAGVFTVTG